jgi:hypothetical protein
MTPTCLMVVGVPRLALFIQDDDGLWQPNEFITTGGLCLATRWKKDRHSPYMQLKFRSMNTYPRSKDIIAKLRVGEEFSLLITHPMCEHSEVYFDVIQRALCRRIVEKYHQNEQGRVDQASITEIRFEWLPENSTGYTINAASGEADIQAWLNNPPSDLSMKAYYGNKKKPTFVDDEVETI